MWREIGGHWLNQFLFLPGGILIRWNSAILTGQLVQVGKFSLIVNFCSFSDHLRWRCTSVYWPNARSCKLDFWAELRGCAANYSVPRVICGGFIAIFALEDKTSCSQFG